MRLNRVDLNLLISLDALLNERNVTRAAAKLHVTQSAMSWALARLREHFDDPLLTRTGRDMTPTSFASELIGPVRELLLRAQVVVERRPDRPIGTIERVIRISASDYFALTILAEAMRQIGQQAPGIRIELRSLADYTSERLLSGETDLLISAMPSLNAAHPREQLVTDRYVGIVASSNTEVGDRLTLEQYSSMGHVATRWRGPNMVTIDEMAIRALAFTRREEVVVPEFTFAPAFIVQTNRVATIQHRLAQIFSKQWPIRIVELPFELPAIELLMQWHRDRGDDPVLVWLRALLQAVVKEQGVVVDGVLPRKQGRTAS